MTGLRVDVAFDFICPWCLIGKRQLDRAIVLLRTSHPELEAEVHWHGVQLLPDLPAEGQDFNTFYQRRLGGPEAVRQRQAQVHAAAAQAGIELDLSQIARMPNTANAHRLFEHARALLPRGQLSHLLERLFAAYFFRAEDLGQKTTLVRIANEYGLHTFPTQKDFDVSAKPFVSAQTASGVPAFTINHKLQFAGAYPAEQIHAAMVQQLEVNT